VIGEVLVLVVVGLLAGIVGLWFGIVIVAPRLQRRVDRADGEESTAAEGKGEADGRAD
jgi:hypothetical protein